MRAHLIVSLESHISHRGEMVISTRNFDPETRTLKKRFRENEEDTVEKAVVGLAEKIVAEEEERRSQDLVRSLTSNLGQMI